MAQIVAREPTVAFQVPRMEDVAASGGFPGWGWSPATPASTGSTLCDTFQFPLLVIAGATIPLTCVLLACAQLDEVGVLVCVSITHTATKTHLIAVKMTIT